MLLVGSIVLLFKPVLVFISFICFKFSEVDRLNGTTRPLDRTSPAPLLGYETRSYAARKDRRRRFDVHSLLWLFDLKNASLCAHVRG